MTGFPNHEKNLSSQEKLYYSPHHHQQQQHSHSHQQQQQQMSGPYHRAQYSHSPIVSQHHRQRQHPRQNIPLNQDNYNYMPDVSNASMTKNNIGIIGDPPHSHLPHNQHSLNQGPSLLTSPITRKSDKPPRQVKGVKATPESIKNFNLADVNQTPSPSLATPASSSSMAVTSPIITPLSSSTKVLIYKVSKNDVLSGNFRKGVKTQEGNKIFRKLVNDCADTFHSRTVASPKDADEMKASGAKIMKEIENLEPNGRFLKFERMENFKDVQEGSFSSIESDLDISSFSKYHSNGQIPVFSIISNEEALKKIMAAIRDKRNQLRRKENKEQSTQSNNDQIQTPTTSRPQTHNQAPMINMNQKNLGFGMSPLGPYNNTTSPYSFAQDNLKYSPPMYPHNAQSYSQFHQPPLTHGHNPGFPTHSNHYHVPLKSGQGNHDYRQGQQPQIPEQNREQRNKYNSVNANLNMQENLPKISTAHEARDKSVEVSPIKGSQASKRKKSTPSHPEDPSMKIQMQKTKKNKPKNHENKLGSIRSGIAINKNGSNLQKRSKMMTNEQRFHELLQFRFDAAKKKGMEPLKFAQQLEDFLIKKHFGAIKAGEELESKESKAKAVILEGEKARLRSTLEKATQVYLNYCKSREMQPKKKKEMRKTSQPKE